MTVYLFVIIFTFIFGLLASYVNIGKNDVIKKDNSYLKNFLIIIILMIWTFVFSFRDVSVGSDTNGYLFFYQLILKSGISLSEFISDQRDLLFATLEFFCSKISNGNWLFFQIIVGLLLYAPVLHVLKEKSDYFTSSLLLYIFTLYFFGGFNGMRQSIAMSLIFYGYYMFFLEHKNIKYFMTMFLAFGFHSSVIFAIPVHLLTRLKINSKLIKIVTMFLLFTFLFIWQIWPMVISFLNLIGQSKMALDYAQLAENQGSGYLRFIIVIIPFVLGLIYKKKLEKEYKNVNAELVLILFGALFVLLSTRYWIFSRIASYFLLSQILFIPKLYSIFNSNSRKIGCFIILTCYFLYMIALLLYGEGGYYPYNFIF